MSAKKTVKKEIKQMKENLQKAKAGRILNEILERMEAEGMFDKTILNKKGKGIKKRRNVKTTMAKNF